MNVDVEKDIVIAGIAKVSDTNPDGTPINESDEYDDLVGDYSESEDITEDTENEDTTIEE